MDSEPIVTELGGETDILEYIAEDAICVRKLCPLPRLLRSGPSSSSRLFTSCTANAEHAGKRAEKLLDTFGSLVRSEDDFLANDLSYSRRR